MFAPLPPPFYGAGAGRRVGNTRYFGILITGERISRWPLIIIIIIVIILNPFLSFLLFPSPPPVKQEKNRKRGNRGARVGQSLTLR